MVLSDATRLRVGREDWLREVEDLLAERGIIVSYEAVRQWCGKFGSEYARRLKKKAGRLGEMAAPPSESFESC